jgi:hypothetical protein
MYDLSILVPGIRYQNWDRLYNSVKSSIGIGYSWEMIICGPYPPSGESFTKESNFKFIRDFGAPARATQIASLLAQGTYMMWAADDGYLLENSLKDSLDLLTPENNPLKGIILRYSEGPGLSGQMPDDNYWKARTHRDQQLPGIKDSYMCAPAGMYYTDMFRWLGGLDCRFEHINMCTHDLAFRFQEAGGTFQLSPAEVLKCDWNPGVGDNIPVQQAYHGNDLGLFQSIWNQPGRQIQISYYNWLGSPERWARRFGNG